MPFIHVPAPARDTAPHSARRAGASLRRSAWRCAAAVATRPAVATPTARAGSLPPAFRWSPARIGCRCRRRGQRHFVGVDHRVGQAADARDNRQRAIAQGAELGQPAWLEARRHQQRIAPPWIRCAKPRRSRVCTPTRPGLRCGGGGEPASSGASPVPSRASCPPAPSRTGSAASSRSIPFCQVSRLITPNSSASPDRVGQAEPVLQRRLVRSRVQQARSASNGAARCGSARRIPYRRVDAVENAARARRRGRAADRRDPCRRPVSDLRGVGGRYGGDPVGEVQPSLEEADGAIVLDASTVTPPAAAADARSSSAGNWPWNARLCTVITVPGRRPPA